MSKKRTKRKPKKPSKAEILAVYEMFDDDDVSTQTLLAMVADSCGCDIDDVVEALVME